MVTTISGCTIIAVSMTNDSASSLSVKYRGVSGYYVCSDQWTSAYSDAVCRQFQHTSVYSSVYAQIRTPFSFSLKLEMHSINKLSRHTNLGEFRIFFIHVCRTSVVICIASSVAVSYKNILWFTSCKIAFLIIYAP